VQAEVMEPPALREALRAEAEAVARQLAPARLPLASAPAATRRRPRPGRHAFLREVRLAPKNAIP
jgi:hypothetical protein